MPPGGNGASLSLQASVFWKVRFPEDLGRRRRQKACTFLNPEELKPFFGRSSQATGTLSLLSPHRQGAEMWRLPPSLSLPLHLLPGSVHHHHAILHLPCLLPWTAHAW